MLTTVLSIQALDVVRRNRVHVVAVLLAVAASSTSCGGHVSGHVQRGGSEVPVLLKTAGTEWDRLFNSHDVAGLAALYAEDAISMPFNAPTIRGRDAIQAEFVNFFSQHTAHHETLVEELLVNEDWAIERARYILTYSAASGQEIRETGRHVVCRKKKDGAWRIAWELWNTDMPLSQ